MKCLICDHNLSPPAHLIHHVEGFCQGHLPKPPNVVCIDLELLRGKVWVRLQGLHKSRQINYLRLHETGKPFPSPHCHHPQVMSLMLTLNPPMPLSCPQNTRDHPVLRAHLGKRACALILDLIVAQIQLCELVIRVLLQRTRQMLCTCMTDPICLAALWDASLDIKPALCFANCTVTSQCYAARA